MLSGSVFPSQCLSFLLTLLSAQAGFAEAWNDLGVEFSLVQTTVKPAMETESSSLRKLRSVSYRHVCPLIEAAVAYTEQLDTDSDSEDEHCECVDKSKASQTIGQKDTQQEDIKIESDPKTISQASETAEILAIKTTEDPTIKAAEPRAAEMRLPAIKLSELATKATRVQVVKQAVESETAELEIIKHPDEGIIDEEDAVKHAAQVQATRNDGVHTRNEEVFGSAVIDPHFET